MLHLSISDHGTKMLISTVFGDCEALLKPENVKGFTFNYKTAKCEPFATVGCTLSKNGFSSELGCQIACEKGDNY